MIRFNENKEIFENHIMYYRNIIDEMPFSEEDLKTGEIIKQELITNNKITDKQDVTSALRFYRNQMIDIKYNHTMRVVEDASLVAEKIGFHSNFIQLQKLSTLLHDYGRFYQATWFNSFSEACFDNMEGINNHAEYGYYLLFKKNKINLFNIQNNLYDAIGKVVAYHGVPVLPQNLSYEITSDALKFDPLTCLKNQKETSKTEKVIISALVQIVKDVDMLDILYQRTTLENPVSRPYISYGINNDNLNTISKRWGISEEEIKKYNNLKTSNIFDLDYIYVPLTNVDPSKLSVPNEIRDLYFNNQIMDLKTLKKRRDWSFIDGMWWQLNHFLSNINFTSNLELLYEKKLLESIYNMYPDKYKPLVKEAFDFATSELLEKRIKESQGKIYAKKR